MEIILLHAILTLLNMLCVLWMYYTKNYKTAIFSGFGAGVSFYALINDLYLI